MIHETQILGDHYEILVDSLKLANNDLAQIEVDQGARTITVYEGGDLTGADSRVLTHGC